MVVQMVHDIWILLHRWKETLQAIGVFFCDNGSRTKIVGKNPCSQECPDGINTSLKAWKGKIDHRFPRNSWDITCTFKHEIPLIYIHIFVEQGNNYDADDEQLSSDHLRPIGRGTPPLHIYTDPLVIFENFKWF